MAEQAQNQAAGTEREELADELEQILARSTSGLTNLYSDAHLGKWLRAHAPNILAALRTQPQAGSVEQVERVARAIHPHVHLLAGPWPEDEREAHYREHESRLTAIAQAAIQSLQLDIASLLAGERERCAKVMLERASHAQSIGSEAYDTWIAAHDAIRSLGSTGGV